MSSRTLKIEGLEEMLKTFGDLAPREAINLARSTVQAIAVEVRNIIRQNAPRDTGELAKRVTARRRRGTPTMVRSTVTIQQPYAIHVEYGVEHAPAQPFIVPAVEQTRPKLKERYRENFGKKYEALLARKAKKAAKG